MPDDVGDSESCPICQKPFVDGDAVVQVVEDRFPTYDKEIVLHTYHRACFRVGETVMHDCPHCGCMFHLALIRQGEEYQNLSLQLFCPFCATLFGCDIGFAAGSVGAPEAELERPDVQAPVEGKAVRVATAGLRVDRELLERQAALLGRAVEGIPLTDNDRACLEGLWEFVHRVIDSM